MRTARNGRGYSLWGVAIWWMRGGVKGIESKAANQAKRHLVNMIQSSQYVIFSEVPVHFFFSNQTT